MDEAVSHEHQRPVFYKRDLVFTHLVVDKVTPDTRSPLASTYTVYYAGSSEYKSHRLYR